MVERGIFSKRLNPIWILLFMFTCAGCSTGPGNGEIDPNYAPVVSIDRFSDSAGSLFKRSLDSSLPSLNEPIDFDRAPFIMQGLAPNGDKIQYYNFDRMPSIPSFIYVFFKEGESSPLQGQLNIIDEIPGETGYNDFWRIAKVIVPADYQENSVTSVAGINARGFIIEVTDRIVNCPVVPRGSSTNLRYTDSEKTEINRGWYKDQIVYYFTFKERLLSVSENNEISKSTMYVSFNIDPGKVGGGVHSGLKKEPGTNQTHNVFATLPTDSDYSSLCMVNVYDNDDFELVKDISSAENATILEEGLYQINCPVVRVFE